MTIRVDEALDADTSEIVVVFRTSPGAYVSGIYQPSIVDTFKTLCSVQQPTPEDLQILSMGERDKDIRKFICKKSVRTTDDKDGTIADVIRYKGKDYKVIQASDWDVYGYTRAFGARKQ
jgi:hypothetical protein